MDKNKESILIPIIFFSFFKFPLKLKELRRYLWQNELEESNIKQVIDVISEINQKDDSLWYGSFVPDRVKREKLAKKYWWLVKKRRWIFSNIPFLKQVFVSNTLAYNNVHSNSDIDLLIIGKSERLWTVRAFLLIWLNLFGWRVRGIKKSGQFSPEFFVSENCLNLNKVSLEDDYYLSFWLADLVPIWPNGKKNLIAKHNSWVKNNLPIAWRSPKEKDLSHLKSSYYAKAVEKILAGRFGEIIENKLHKTQLSVINKTRARIGVNPEIITENNIIKLHFNDRRKQVSDLIKKGLNDIFKNC